MGVRIRVLLSSRTNREIVFVFLKRILDGYLENWLELIKENLRY